MAIITLDDAAEAAYADAFAGAVSAGMNVGDYIADQLGRPAAVDPRHRPEPAGGFEFDDGGFPVFVPGQTQRMTA